MSLSCHDPGGFASVDTERELAFEVSETLIGTGQHANGHASASVEAVECHA